MNDHIKKIAQEKAILERKCYELEKVNKDLEATVKNFKEKIAITKRGSGLKI